jgi:ribosomal protein S19E (S16A)
LRKWVLRTIWGRARNAGREEIHMKKQEGKIAEKIMKKMKKGAGYILESPTGRRAPAEVLIKAKWQGKRVALIMVDL